MPEPVIYVVDDDEAVGRALASAGGLLGREVRVFPTAADFLAAFDPAQPGCLVLDIRMPGMTGPELQRKLADDGAAIPIVMISGHADVRTAVAAMTAGAVTLLEKPFRLDELLVSIRKAIDKDRTDREVRGAAESAAARLARLTAKEREVLELVATGISNREMAERLGLSVRAVEDRRSRAMKKVEADSVADLMRLLAAK